MAGNKYFSDNVGQQTEVASNNSSVGSGDANKIVSLNASGQIDATMLQMIATYLRSFAASVG